MLATGMDRDKRTRLFIDVGTNCEIVLSDGDRIVSTAAPGRAGLRGRRDPVRHARRRRRDRGGQARPGDGRRRALQVIGDVEPKGLCGSGLVDAVAELVKVGLLDASGRFVPDEEAAEIAPGLADRLTMVGEERVFVLHRPDARTPTPADCVVPLAARRPRAAVRQGRDLDRLVAAARASSASSPATSSRCCSPGRSAPTSPPPPRCGSAWCPKLPVLRIVSAGNVAGEGAKMALLSVRERAGAAALLEEVTYVELSDRADFNDRFVDQLAF